MTYRPGGKPWTRPTGRPYPSDPTYRHMVRNVDTFRREYRTDHENHIRSYQRRRFLEMITVDEKGCWIWLGPVDTARSQLPRFTGTWSFGKRYRIGHPFVWLIQEWFPDQLAHLRKTGYRTWPGCGNRLCVRPQCRYASSTPGANRLPMETRGLGRRLTPGQVRWIREQRRPGRQLARELGVAVQTVHNVLSEKTYAWVLQGGPLEPPESSSGGQTPAGGTVGPQEGQRGA